MKIFLIGITAVIAFTIFGEGNSTRTDSGIKVSVSCFKEKLSKNSNVISLAESHNQLNFNYQGLYSTVTFEDHENLTKNISINVTGKIYNLKNLRKVSTELHKQIFSTCTI